MAVTVLCLFLLVPWVGQQCVIVVYLGHQGGQSHGQHDEVHKFPEPVKLFRSFVILLSRISCGKEQKKALIFFCTRLCQSFSWVCCSFPDYLEQLKKKKKFSAIGYTLQLFKEIWKTAANTGETFTQSYADKYEGCFALYRMKFDLV